MYNIEMGEYEKYIIEEQLGKNPDTDQRLSPSTKIKRQQMKEETIDIPHDGLFDVYVAIVDKSVYPKMPTSYSEVFAIAKTGVYPGLTRQQLDSRLAEKYDDKWTVVSIFWRPAGSQRRDPQIKKIFSGTLV